MTIREYQASGLEYLELVTALLQRARRADPTGGLWEAADLQWWWRRDQHRDPTNQIFWLDRDTPVAAVVLTDWGGRWGCDLLGAGDDLAPLVGTVWPRALERIDAVGGAVEIAVRDDDPALIDLVTGAGFEATDEVGVATWMPAADRAGPAPLADGFELLARGEVAARPHHLTRRGDDQVEARLRECSLYRPALDLAVYTPDGDVAAYGLFWADPVTGVGLVEPMRTEDAYQGQGLARHVLATGLELLAAHGCSRLKVSYLAGNEAARRLYLGAGFRRDAISRTYRRKR
jgi:RimJ/RimL family protein N-acetyltransferase